jgi:RNA polymerase-binding transcription factor DksA
MSDDADMTQDRMELEDKIRKKYTQRLAKEAEANGYCLECGEDLPAEKRWCDANCRDLWEERRRLR